jgi:uncharacterized BrkB/YihY/UPF0761 family membrane protein
MRFLAVFALASWFPHVEGDWRWLLFGLFTAALVWLLKGLEA